MAIVVLWAVVLVAIVGHSLFTIVTTRHDEGPRPTAAHAIARQVDGEVVGTHVVGRRNGVAVDLQFAVRASGATWMAIDAVLPGPYPLALYVRRHGVFDRLRTASGTLTDVELGDRAFDETFLVEGAPADVTRTLLDATVRRFLVRHRFAELATMSLDGRPAVRLALTRWLDNIPEALEAIDITTRIAAGIRDAYPSPGEPQASPERGAPYRPVLDDTQAPEPVDARLAEVHRLVAQRAARAERARYLGRITIAVIAAAIVTLALAH